MSGCGLAVTDHCQERIYSDWVVSSPTRYIAVTERKRKNCVFHSLPGFGEICAGCASMIHNQNGPLGGPTSSLI